MHDDETVGSGASEEVEVSADNPRPVNFAGLNNERPAPDPDTLPTAADPNGKCPRCGRISNFELLLGQVLRRRTFDRSLVDIERVSVLKCRGCTVPHVVIEQQGIQEDNRWDFGAGWHGVLWWPTPGSDDIDDTVPAAVAGAYDEGARCVAVEAPHAAVAMFRTALAHIVEDKGSEEARAKKDLYHRIEQMVEDRTLWESFGKWATHIRQTGNAGAHPEKFEPVTMDQAVDLQMFLRELLNFLYLQPARLSSAMLTARKSSPGPPSA